MIDDLIDDLRKRFGPRWDALRERRLLRGVEQGLEGRRLRRNTRRRNRLIAGAASLSAGVLFAGYFASTFKFSQGHRAIGAQVASVQVAADRPPTADVAEHSVEATETRVLADGTRLKLSHRALIAIQNESLSRVELIQSAGRVRYEVPPLPDRAFVVFAGGVRVQVKGTVFVVDIDAGKVTVKVERGLVRVAAKSGEVALGAGDELSTPADDAAPADSVAPANAAVAVEAGRPARIPRIEASPNAPSVSALLDRADTERSGGDLRAASATLREVVGRYPNDRRAPLAWFTLGKVERARDEHASAAKAFHTSFSLSPDGPLSDDALAEEAVSWAAAGNSSLATRAAEDYLERFRNGPHRARMQRILE